MDKKEFIKNFTKSYQFQNNQLIVSSEEQKAAEETVDPELLSFLKAMVEHLALNEVAKMPLKVGELTLSKEDSNLFQGFVQDECGQVIAQIEKSTLEIVAKNLMVKNMGLLDSSAPLDITQKECDECEYEEQETVESPKYLKIRLGDFELELRKSIVTNASSLHKVKKGLEIFRKSMKDMMNLKGDRDILVEILENWDTHGERVQQIFFAIDQMSESND